MRKLWLVCCKELRMTATRAYLIATAIGPIVIFALIPGYSPLRGESWLN